MSHYTIGNDEIDRLVEKYKQENQEKIVAFIDVLGFKEKVKNDDRSLKLFAVNLCHYIDKNYEKIDIAMFSDSMYLLCDKKDFNEILEFISYLQYRLLFFNEECCLNGEPPKRSLYLLRGAITMGNVFRLKEDDILFGKAVVRAYELESKEAKMPGIMFDKEKLAEVESKYTKWAVLRNMAEEMEDNVLCFDYIKYIFEKNIEIGEDQRKSLYETISYEKEKLAEMESGEKQKIMEKLEYFENYIKNSIKIQRDDDIVGGC